MSDAVLATALRGALETERAARVAWAQARDRADVPETDRALVVMRQAGALRRALEQWIAARAMRRALDDEGDGRPRQAASA